MESSSVTSGMARIPHPGPSGIPRHPMPVISDPPTTSQPKISPPPILWKEGDTFSSVLEKYSGWRGSRLTPRKCELLTYTLLYHDDTASDTHISSDEEKDVSTRIGIEGVSEILQESGCVMGEKIGVKDESGARKHARVMGEGSRSGKDAHVIGEESERAEGSGGWGRQ